MKPFRFPLDRVTGWRGALAGIEEAALERLRAEWRGLGARQAELHQQRAESARSVLAADGTTGLELAALDAFRRFASAEHARLELRRSACARRIAAQIEKVVQKRRDVRLLEGLRERKLREWTAAAGRESDAEAQEAYLARWNATRPRPPE